MVVYVKMQTYLFSLDYPSSIRAQVKGLLQSQDGVRMMTNFSKCHR